MTLKHGGQKNPFNNNVIKSKMTALRIPGFEKIQS